MSAYNQEGMRAGRLLLARCPEVEKTAKELLLECLPNIARAEASRQPNANDAKGWLYLAEMLDKWFGEKVARDAEGRLLKNPESFSVDWGWAMSYARTRDGYEWLVKTDFSSEEGVTHNIYNQVAKNMLAGCLKRYLEEFGSFNTDGTLRYSRVYFDFSQTPKNQWHGWSFNFIDIQRPTFAVDGLFAAMGAFALRALAKGYIDQIDGRWCGITVTDCWIFVHDLFNFERNEDLRYWSCEQKGFSRVSIEGYRRVNNSDFRSYRDRHNYGRDFDVISDLHEVENFAGINYTHWV